MLHVARQVGEMMSKYWTVASYPEETLSEANFEMKEAAQEKPGPGEFLIETLYLIVTPPLRMAVGTGGISGNPLPLGSVMNGTGIGKVIASNHDAFAVGDLVQGGLGWREHVVSDGATKVPVERINPREDLPFQTSLHVMGASGATAYVGLYDLGLPRVGDTVFVTAAAGTVGATVCQLAKLSGCKVVGSTGTDEKCDWLTGTLGMDGAINYKKENVGERLGELCPRGINIVFDNVGGAALDDALANISQGARVVLCGAPSQYEVDGAWYGPTNYFNLVYREASMRGFYIFNHRHRFKEAYARLGELITTQQLSYAEDVLGGIEQVPTALVRVLNGDNFGTQLVKIN